MPSTHYRTEALASARQHVPYTGSAVAMTLCKLTTFWGFLLQTKTEGDKLLSLCVCVCVCGGGGGGGSVDDKTLLFCHSALCTCSFTAEQSNTIIKHTLLKFWESGLFKQTGLSYTNIESPSKVWKYHRQNGNYEVGQNQHKSLSFCDDIELTRDTT